MPKSRNINVNYLQFGTKPFDGDRQKLEQRIKDGKYYLSCKECRNSNATNFYAASTEALGVSHLLPHLDSERLIFVEA